MNEEIDWSPRSVVDKHKKYAKKESPIKCLQEHEQLTF